MRVSKAILTHVPLKLVWVRITASKWTLAFFWTVVAHCLLQVGLESFAFVNNDRAIDILRDIIRAGSENGTNTDLGIAVYSDGNLEVCDGVPGASTCRVIWSSSRAASTAAQASSNNPYTVAQTSSVTTSSVPTTSSSTSAASTTSNAESASSTTTTTTKASASATFATTSSTSTATTGSATDNARRAIVPAVGDAGELLGVLITDEGVSNDTILVSTTCVASLQVPEQALLNARRVDFTFMAFQVWLLGMSVVAILNESVPHIIAAFATHIVATVWSGYQVYSTASFRSEFRTLVINGPCKTNVIPNYWLPRERVEISILSLNVAVTLAVGFLSYKLLKSFGWQTFKKIGASFTINRCYRLVLALSITIQLAVFFVGANVALWLDQLYHGTVAMAADHRTIYEAVGFTIITILIPWLAIGWFAVRSESRHWMAVFLGMAVVMITAWVSAFTCKAFVWTFKDWPYFGFMTVTTAALLVAAIGLGLACRLNFGKGLPEYLVREDLGVEPAWEPANEKTYGDEEKLVQFPSENDAQPIPTFSEAFVGPEGLERLRAMSRPAARSGPGIGMHARGDSTSGSTDFQVVGLPARPDVARSASTASRTTVSSRDSPSDDMVQQPVDPRLAQLTRINTMDSQRSHRSQNSASSATPSSRINRPQRWALDE